MDEGSLLRVTEVEASMDVGTASTSARCREHEHGMRGWNRAPNCSSPHRRTAYCVRDRIRLS